MHTTTRREFLEVCRLVYDRYLTNAAGSNFSARASENTLYVSMTGNAKRNRLRMAADDLLLVDLNGNILEGEGMLTSLWPTHRKMYEEFDFVGAVIHAHPRLATTFACRKKPMPAFTAAMKKFGPIPLLSEDINEKSEECGRAVADIFRAKGESFRTYGHAVLYPYHGVMIAAPTLDDAYDLLERMEFNAYAIIGNAILDLAGYA